MYYIMSWLGVYDIFVWFGCFVLLFFVCGLFFLVGDFGGSGAIEKWLFLKN